MAHGVYLMDPCKIVIGSCVCVGSLISIISRFGGFCSYEGLRNTAPNLFYVTGGKFVYYTAALGIVANPVPCRVGMG